MTLVLLILAGLLAVDAVFVMVMARRYDDASLREAERRRLCEELEAAEAKPYAVIDKSRRGPERVA